MRRLLPCYSVRGSSAMYGWRVTRAARTRGGRALPAAGITGGYPMRDPRNATLARVIIRHSTRLEPGEAILIESFDLNTGLVLDLVDAALDAKGIPVVYLRSNAVNRSEEHTSELQSRSDLVCRLLLEKKKKLRS